MAAAGAGTRYPRRSSPDAERASAASPPIAMGAASKSSARASAPPLAPGDAHLGTQSVNVDKSSKEKRGQTTRLCDAGRHQKRDALLTTLSQRCGGTPKPTPKYQIKEVYTATLKGMRAEGL